MLLVWSLIANLLHLIGLLLAPWLRTLVVPLPVARGHTFHLPRLLSATLQTFSVNRPLPKAQGENRPRWPCR